MNRILFTVLTVFFFITNVISQNVTVNSTSGIVTSATYNTLKSAFDSINGGYHTGDIVISITGDVLEGANSAKLDSSGRVFSWGTSSYTSVLIRPVGGAWTISGNPAAGQPLIDLNGADNVTINGLQNGADSLKISNTTISATSNTSTIRLINDATNNTITNVYILSGSTASTTTNGGALFISTAASGGNGNDNNTISNCYFSNSSATNTSFANKFIYINGTATNANICNSDITITNNHFVNFRANGIYVNTGTRHITISSNHFYHNATMASSSVIFAPIFISNVTSSIGEGYNINGNYIGGSQPFCGGTQSVILLGSTATQLIYLGCAITAPSYINGNTIANISIQSTYSSTEFGLIYIKGGRVDIGSQQGNIIGSLTDTSNVILLHNSTTGGNYAFITIGGNAAGTFDTIRVENNLIGGITLKSLNTNTPSTRAFDCAGTTGNLIIRNNSFGIPGIANSIQVYGFNGNTFPVIIRNSNANVNEMVKNYVGNFTFRSSTASAGGLTGMLMGSNNWKVDSNTIENLVVYTSATSPTAAQLTGISISSLRSCVGNSVKNLISMHPTSTPRIIGMDVSGNASSATAICAGNSISNIYAVTSNSATIIGLRIRGLVSTPFTVHNNQISLGKDSIGSDITGAYTITGLARMSGVNEMYYNSVLIDGVNVGSTANTYALYDTIGGMANFRNNVFSNQRSFSSTSTNYNYAAYHADTVMAGSIDSLTSNYNLFFANGVGAMLMGSGLGSNYTDLTSWKTDAFLHDVNSVSGNPDFISYNLLRGNSSSFIAVGDNTTGINIDITNSIRTTNLMGAYDWSVALPVSFIYINGSVLNNSASLNWATASEINNSGFEIQRSIDGLNFNSVGFVAGKGNSISLFKYSFLDVNAFALTNVNTLYYRLKQMDNNGKFEYSKLVSINIQKVTNVAFTVFPNPFIETINVVFTASNNSISSFKIIDYQGVLIFQKNIKVKKGMNSIVIDELYNLPKGAYILSIEIDGVQSTHKIYK